MKINLNGGTVDTDSPNIQALVDARGLDPSSLVVEHNFNVLKQADWASTPVQEGDTIELLNFVGGG